MKLIIETHLNRHKIYGKGYSWKDEDLQMLYFLLGNIGKDDLLDINTGLVKVISTNGGADYISVKKDKQKENSNG